MLDRQGSRSGAAGGEHNQPRCQFRQRHQMFVAQFLRVGKQENPCIAKAGIHRSMAIEVRHGGSRQPLDYVLSIRIAPREHIARKMRRHHPGFEITEQQFVKGGRDGMWITDHQGPRPRRFALVPPLRGH